MIIGRTEQFAGHAATVNHLKVALGRIDFHFRRVEKEAQMIAQSVRNRRVFAFERNPVRDRHRQRSRLPGLRFALRRIADRPVLEIFGQPALQHDDETVVFADDRPGDVEKFKRAAGRPDGLGQRGETGVLRIKRRGEKRAVVRSAFLRTAAGTKATATLVAHAFMSRAAAKISPARPARKLTLRSPGFAHATGRRCASARRGGRVACRFAEGAAIATIGSPAVIPTLGRAFAAWTIVVTRFAPTGFVLRPLRAKAKALELGQVDLVETRRRGFLRSVVVHGVGGSGRGAREVAWSGGGASG